MSPKRVIYDPEANILSVEIIKSASIDHAIKLGRVIIHFPKRYVPIPILIEVLEASNWLFNINRAVNKEPA